MHIDIDRNSDINLKEQIRQAITDRIRSGLLTSAQKLPSVRLLASQLSISLITAVEAYRLLEKDGLVETIQGKGTFVTPLSLKGEALPSPVNPFSWQVALNDYLPRASYWSHSAQNLPAGILDLATASIHHSLLPLTLLSSSIKKALQDYPDSLGSYSPFQGDKEFLQVISAYLKSQDINLDSHQLIVTNGTQQGIDLFARTFLGPGDVLAMETPTFSGAIDAFRLTHATIQPVPVDQDGLRVDILEDLSTRVNIKAVYVVPTHHNPTGSLMSIKRRRQLIEFCQQNNVLILEDEPHRELCLTGNKDKLPSTLKSMDNSGRVIFLKGFSKFLFPGLRLGIIAAEGTVYSRLLAAKSIVDLGSPLWLQKALIPFFTDTRLKKYIQQLNQELLNRSSLVAKKLTSQLNPQVHWHKPSGGMYLWLTLPRSLSADRLVPEAHRRGIHFLPGSIFYPGEPESNHLRICWTNLPGSQLPIALDILCKLINETL